MARFCIASHANVLRGFVTRSYPTKVVRGEGTCDARLRMSAGRLGFASNGFAFFFMEGVFEVGVFVCFSLALTRKSRTISS